ncbi:hypothetical protein BUALT_Bualt08G0135900 [Buddleja alternifolia]|uniref:G-patch domain-containing protein n=1 Tax=Buddleja alternifolia TaxID=168488 RepID=A0AAV6XEA5_9LAMI|nr:hypothetical protein BUALT_Bualt08G0135900 [Buddleja alternifolia]
MEVYELKRRSHQTKEDVLYGVFAEGDSDADGLLLGSNKRRKGGITKNTDFTKVSMAFVDRSNSDDENNQTRDDPNSVGEFEKHTKGIGMRLLQKMGYKGVGGLGKHEQGIVAPIQTELRPKNMGLGFKYYKQTTTLPPLEVKESDEEKSLPRLPLERRSKNKKKVFITAEELLAKKQEQDIQVVEKIIDMRGPHVRVLTNFERLSAVDEDDVRVSEFQHNLRLLDDLAELDIQKLDRDLRNERENNVVSLEKEKEKLQEEAHDRKQQISNVEEIMSVLDQIGETSSAGTLTLESLAESFLDLQVRFAKDYNTSCNLSCIAWSYALPLFIRRFQGWDPFQNPIRGVEVISLWKELLLLGGKNEFNSYVQLMVRYIIPKLAELMHDVKIKDLVANLNMDQFHWLRTWSTVIPTHHILQLMDIFFDKWQEVLYHLLYSNPPCFEEVLKWYLNVKEFLPPELRAKEHIRYRLNRCLEMMDQAVESMEVGSKENMSCYIKREFENQKISAAQAQKLVEISLKNVIELHAQQNGLVLKPKAGRTRDGLQIYGFGNISIIIDSHNQKVFANTEEDRWSLVSLEQLLNLQNRPSSKRH